MSLPQKRVHWTETVDGVLYDEDVDIYTSAKAVLYEDGTNLEDNISNCVGSELIGNLEDLTTTDKSSLVSAIAEMQGLNDNHVKSLESLSGGSKVFWLEKYPIEYKNVKVSTLPNNCFEACVVVLNGEIHKIGGDSAMTTHYKYNGSTWESVSTLPYKFMFGCAVVYNNEIHIMGGYDYSTYYTYHYKWNGSSWESVSTLPYALYAGSAVVFNNEIHILGSQRNSNTYKYHYKYNGTSWSSVSTLPYSFYHGDTVVYNNEIHIMGSNNSSYKTAHYKYNGSSWSSVSTLPYNFDRGNAVILDNEVHILGGVSGNNTNHYKWNGSSWISILNLPFEFYQNCAVVYKGKIHIMGGNDSTTKYYHYSLNTPPIISGYCKQNYTIYLPISSTPLTDNLASTDEGYLVTDSGYVEIAVG